jgi:hypothetical protein
MARNLVSPILCDTAADLQAFDGAKMFSKTLALVASISATAPVPGMYRWVAGSASADGNQSQLIVVPTVGAASGRWARCDQKIDLILPFTFATADRAVLYTNAAEHTLWLLLDECLWEVTTAFSGGAGSRIALSIATGPIADSNGTLMGGAGGDGIGTNPTLNAAQMWKPTAGAGSGAGAQAMVLRTAGDQILFNQVVSAFTAGVGLAHVPCNLIANAITPPPP